MRSRSLIASAEGAESRRWGKERASERSCGGARESQGSYRRSEPVWVASGAVSEGCSWSTLREGDARRLTQDRWLASLRWAGGAVKTLAATPATTLSHTRAAASSPARSRLLDALILPAFVACDGVVGQELQWLEARRMNCPKRSRRAVLAGSNPSLLVLFRDTYGCRRRPRLSPAKRLLGRRAAPLSGRHRGTSRKSFRYSAVVFPPCLFSSFLLWLSSPTGGVLCRISVPSLGVRCVWEGSGPRNER